MHINTNHPLHPISCIQENTVAGTQNVSHSEAVLMPYNCLLERSAASKKGLERMSEFGADVYSNLRTGVMKIVGSWQI
jgi:hypothetical protein